MGLIRLDLPKIQNLLPLRIVVGFIPRFSPIACSPVLGWDRSRGADEMRMAGGKLSSLAIGVQGSSRL